ncbi:MAG TPA: hypothetical protein DD706_01710 [Nitrospiraceae bacterium]|nr:hypothetical protein [Nitrospiraceae bacterium]
MGVECRFVVGFRPGSRATFVSAKVAKTMDAPSGFKRGAGRKFLDGGPTRLAQTRSAMRASLPWASRKASLQGRGGHTDKDGFENSLESL